MLDGTGKKPNFHIILYFVYSLDKAVHKQIQLDKLGQSSVTNIIKMERLIATK